MYLKRRFNILTLYITEIEKNLALGSSLLRKFLVASLIDLIQPQSHNQSQNKLAGLGTDV